jgi:long-chain acyl-CoA synthetase
MAEELGINESYDKLCQNQAIRIEILTELNNIGKKSGLQGFEQAKNIFLDPNGFMIKGILTNTMKIQRH